MPKTLGKHKAKLEAEFRTGNNPKAAMLYATAYEMGHSSSLDEIRNYYIELMPLIMPPADLSEAVALVRRLRGDIESMPWPTDAKLAFRINKDLVEVATFLAKHAPTAHPPSAEGVPGPSACGAAPASAKHAPKGEEVPRGRG